MIKLKLIEIRVETCEMISVIMHLFKTTHDSCHGTMTSDNSRAHIPHTQQHIYTNIDTNINTNVNANILC